MKLKRFPGERVAGKRRQQPIILLQTKEIKYLAFGYVHIVSEREKERNKEKRGKKHMLNIPEKAALILEILFLLR